MSQYSRRYITPKPHIYKVCGRWVWMQAGKYSAVTKKDDIQRFVDCLNDAEY